MKSPYEGRIVAEKYRERGFNAAVLDYRCRPYSIYAAIEDAKRAMRLLRFNADEWHIDKDKIAICGFSAGAHLSTMVGLHSDNGDMQAEKKIEKVSCKPNAVIQCYGAISFLKHGSQLFGEDKKIKEMLWMTPEWNVSINTPPFFMWMTGKDQIIDRTSLYDMAKALEAHEISYELHLFPEGVHGVGLADGTNKFGGINAHTAHWMELSCEWLESMGF